MSEDTTGAGMPTRAIHEAYITLQQAHRQYRRARDRGADGEAEAADFQDAVLTFYELVRPHLKHESALSEYWAGELPDYTGWDFDTTAEAREYVSERGTGVYQTQLHQTTVALDQEVVADGGLNTFREWHNVLGLSWGTERVVAVGRDRDGEGHTHIAQILRCAVLPLRELDDWQATVTRQRTSGDGFMSGESSVAREREFQPPQKLVAAKRLLVEAADQLGALSAFDASAQRTEITREDMERVEAWRQKQLDN